MLVRSERECCKTLERVPHLEAAREQTARRNPLRLRVALSEWTAAGSRLRTAAAAGGSRVERVGAGQRAHLSEPAAWQLAGSVARVAAGIANREIYGLD